MAKPFMTGEVSSFILDEKTAFEIKQKAETNAIKKLKITCETMFFFVEAKDVVSAVPSRL